MNCRRCNKIMNLHGSNQNGFYFHCKKKLQKSYKFLIFTIFAAWLRKSYQYSTTKFEKEHVTQYIHLNKDKFSIYNIQNTTNLSQHRWTIDTLEDYRFAKIIYENLYVKDQIFSPEEIYDLLEQKPYLVDINKHVNRSTLY